MFDYNEDDSTLMGYNDDNELMGCDTYGACYLKGERVSDDDIDRMLDQALMAGYDIDDPQMMAGFLKNLIKKIGKRIKARKAKGVSIQTPKFGLKTGDAGIDVTTGKGSLSVGPGGINWSDIQRSAQKSGSLLQERTQDILKNPVVIGAGIGVLALIALSRK